MRLLLPFFALLASACAGLAGCRAAEGSAAARPQPSMDLADHEESRGFGIRCGEEILAGFKEGDYGKVSRNLPEELQRRLTERRFEEVRGGVGVITGYEFLTELRNPWSARFLWKVGVKTENGDGAEAAGDLLFSLGVVKKDGRYQVSSCVFN